MAAITVATTALVILAAVQLAALVATWRPLRRLDETLRQVAASAEQVGQAATHFGTLALSARNVTEGVVGLAAFSRLAPGVANNAAAIKAGIELGTTIWKAITEHLAKSAPKEGLEARQQ